MDRPTLGLDLGTTGCKVVALGADGTVLGSAAATYPLLTDASGRAEQDPAAIWEAACTVLRQLTGELGPDFSGLALGGAMHSVLTLGADGEPLGHALTWADSRADKLRLPEAELGALYERTGCPAEVPYHPARLRWLREAKPELFQKLAKVAALKDFVGYRLTGTLATDVGMASTTGLHKLRGDGWDELALEHAGISAEMLPELLEPTAQLGLLTAAAASLTGLEAGLPIFTGSSDGALANLGSGVVRPGETVVTVGTSGAVRRVVAEPWLNEDRLTWCYRFGRERLFAGGAVNNGGLALGWLRRTLYSELPKDEGFEQLLSDAAQAEPGDLICLPYLTGERTPYWDASLRGSFFGLGEHHTRADLARAGLEGVAFSLAGVFDLLGVEDKPVQLSGGVTRNPFWAQLLTDTLGATTELNNVADASAIGAALVAQTALGWSTLEAVARDVADEERPTLTPDPDAHARLTAKRRRAQALLAATRDLT